MDEILRFRTLEEGTDAERIATLIGFPRTQLLQLDAENVSPARTGEAPAGVRACEVSVAGGLLDHIGQAADSPRSVVLPVRDWLKHGKGDGRASATNQEQLTELRISRCAKDEDGR
jgi:hypothetical protein